MEKDLARQRKFGAYLRSLRNALGMSQRQVGEKIGMSFPYLAQIERGERLPSPDKIARLAEGYAVSKELLLQEAGLIEGRSAGVETGRIDWAFESVCRDSDFRYGTRVRRQPLDLNTKALVCEIYVESTGRHLFKADEDAAINSLIQSHPRIGEEVAQDLWGAFSEMVVALHKKHPDSHFQIPDLMDCLSTAWECGKFHGIVAAPIPTDGDSIETNLTELRPTKALPERAIKMQPSQAVNQSVQAKPLRKVRMNRDAPLITSETPLSKEISESEKATNNEKSGERP